MKYFTPFDENADLKLSADHRAGQTSKYLQLNKFTTFVLFCRFDLYLIFVFNFGYFLFHQKISARCMLSCVSKLQVPRTISAFCDRKAKAFPCMHVELNKT